jgi:hypothetical protein
MEYFQILKKNNSTICLVAQDELDDDLDQADFKQRIYEIYSHHFLVEVLDDKALGRGKVVKGAEKI